MSESVINGMHIYHSFVSGYIQIEKNREYINKINVFPVPDGDTGTNMTGTFKTIISGLSARKSAGAVLNRMADLSLEGARGNSGIIISQYLNTLAREIGNSVRITLSDFGNAVKKSAVGAYEALENPQEGTMLTVLKSWTDTLFEESRKNITVDELFERGLQSARIALKKTPDQLQVLKDNKVVDAGAWGLVSFFEGVGNFLKKGPVSLSQRKTMVPEMDEFQEEHTHGQAHIFQDLNYRYCTEVLLDECTTPAVKIRKKISDMGDSLIVSQGLGKVRVHIHSNDPSKVVSTLGRYGRVVQQKADDMVRQEQVVNRRLGKIAVLTDSIADIHPDLLDRYQIHVLNLKLIWDEEEFLDRITISPEEFYRQQGIRSSFPSSTVPDTKRIDKIYQYLLEHYEGILVLPVAKALSGTCQQMKNTAEKYNKKSKRIHVVDTCLNSVAQGLLVLESAKESVKNRTLSELADYAESLKRRIRIYVSVSTFKYMVKGGRISALKGFIVHVLHLKPIVSLDENGKGVAFDKAFSRAGLLKKIARLLEKEEAEEGIAGYAVVHAAARDKALEFSDLCEAIIEKPPEFITSISPIVGMHSGKGAVAIGVILKS